MRELTENLRHEAERRLREIEEELRIGYPHQDSSTSKYDKINLIRERLQLRLVLGDLEGHQPMGQSVPTHDNSHLHKEDIMKIEFETDHVDSLQFYMVKDGQMFIGEDGCLYQKSSDCDGDAWRIADSDGVPRGCVENFDEDQAILKLLPMIRRIAF